MKKPTKISPRVGTGINVTELALLGDGEVAYIRPVTPKLAGRMFPEFAPLPKGMRLFALCSADGSPLTLTDTWDEALGRAVAAELAVRVRRMLWRRNPIF